MSDINQTEQNSIDKFQYSFTKDFQSFSYIKKLLTLVLLPLMPIYIISNGFQYKSWKNKGGDKKPSAKKYYFFLSLLYIITVYPISITIGYFILSIYLSPLILLLSVYLHKKDYSIKDEIQHGTKSEEFKVIGFNKKSSTFLLFVIFVFIFTGFGLLFLITFTSFLFILFPNLYKKLYFIPRGFLILSYSFFSFLNFIPGVYVAGEWFIEKDSEVKVLKNPFQIIKKIISNFEPFFILNVGISALMVRILLFVRHDPQDVTVLSKEALSGPGFLGIFLLVPIIMCTYFAWVWVWDDAEIKVARAKISTGSMQESKIKETTLLLPVSDSIKRIYSYAFGLTPIIWLVDRISTSTVENLPTGIFGIAVIMILAFFATGISTIFMGIMYYRSGAHEYLVNKLRKEIKEKYQMGLDSIKICYSGIQEVDPNSLKMTK